MPIKLYKKTPTIGDIFFVTWLSAGAVIVALGVLFNPPSGGSMIAGLMLIGFLLCFPAVLLLGALRLVRTYSVEVCGSCILFVGKLSFLQVLKNKIEKDSISAVEVLATNIDAFGAGKRGRRYNLLIRCNDGHNFLFPCRERTPNVIESLKLNIERIISGKQVE